MINRRIVSSSDSLPTFALEEKADDETSVSSELCPKHQTKNVYIRICTFNVNSQVPNISLDSWLGLENKSDVIVIGIQELTFKAQEIALSLKYVNAEMEEWISKILSSRNMAENYAHFISRRMGSLLLIILVKKNCQSNIHNLMVGKLATGNLGMANKGAVAISFSYKRIKLCFINAHLAAGPSNEQKRAQDFHFIISNLTIGTPGPNKTRRTVIGGQHNTIFFFGDLNFRMMNTSAFSVHKKICNLKYPVENLLQYDEFNQLKHLDPFYEYFQEPHIRFLPSYKYKNNSEEFNLKDKNRCPSYTDRILWNGKNCINLTYKMHPEIKFSDHRPISADFYISMPQNDSQHCKGHCKGRCNKSTDTVSVKLENETLNFETVKFLENKSVVTSIQNIGSTVVRYKFTWFKYNEKLPRWLMIIPRKGVLESGEHVKVSFDVNIQYEDVSKFNMGLLTISGTLIFLRFHTGDFKPIKLQGSFQSTLFGLPLSVLWSLKKPVSEMTSAEIMQVYLETKPDVKPDNSLAMSLLMKLIHFLKPHIMRHGSSMYEVEGVQPELVRIRDMLDSNTFSKDADRISSKSVLEIIFIFLIALPKPLIPIRVLEVCIKNKNTVALEDIAALMSRLPRGNKYLLQRLCCQLTIYIDHSQNQEVAMITHCLTASIFRYEPLHEMYKNTVLLFELMLSKKITNSSLMNSVTYFPDMPQNRRSSKNIHFRGSHKCKK